MGTGTSTFLLPNRGKWKRRPEALDNPSATARILYGDGHGNFRKTVLAQGEGWHDGKIADFEDNGDMDLLQKPYAWSAPPCRCVVEQRDRECASTKGADFEFKANQIISNQRSSIVHL
jgi:hypothetical protein